MPSFKTGGKSKEDLSVVAQLSGLLTAEETRRMTRTELVKFLENENEKAERATQGNRGAQPDESPEAPPAAPVKRRIGRKKAADEPAGIVPPEPEMNAESIPELAGAPVVDTAVEKPAPKTRGRKKAPLPVMAVQPAPENPVEPVSTGAQEHMTEEPAAAPAADKSAAGAGIVKKTEQASARAKPGRKPARTRMEKTENPAAEEPVISPAAPAAEKPVEPASAVVAEDHVRAAEPAAKPKRRGAVPGRRRQKELVQDKEITLEQVKINIDDNAENLEVTAAQEEKAAPAAEQILPAAVPAEEQARSEEKPAADTAGQAGQAEPEPMADSPRKGATRRRAGLKQPENADRISAGNDLSEAVSEPKSRRKIAPRTKKQPDDILPAEQLPVRSMPEAAITEPVMKPDVAAAPAAEPAEPVAEPVAEPAAEPVAELVVEPAVELAVEPSPEAAEAAAGTTAPRVTPPSARPGAERYGQPHPGRPATRNIPDQGPVSRIPRLHPVGRPAGTRIVQQPGISPVTPVRPDTAAGRTPLAETPASVVPARETPVETAPPADIETTIVQPGQPAGASVSIQTAEQAAESISEKSEGEAVKEKRPIVETGESQGGVLEIMPDGYGFLRKDNYLQGNKDIYVPPQYIRRFGLRPGDYVTGPVKLQRENDRYQALLYIKDVNGQAPEKMLRRPHFDRLTPIYPNDRFILETTRNELSTRIIDLVAPIGKGQRGMIVSPPKAGKTILLQKIANAISVNNPDTKLIVLLIDERPEEVTDMQRSINGEVVYSTFDKTPENHTKVVELVLERAMRLVELKQDVIILLDSMTRLARAYNLTINPTGRTLSGGLDPGALYGPKRFFGAARNIENGGSLTIVATSLIETGSRMDEVIFEEFKGTGNMEVYLDRKLSEKRIFPAIDINKSGTRREELLMNNKELDAVWTIRKAFSQLDTSAVTEAIINLLLKTKNNEHFISSVNVSFNDKNVFEAMRGTRPGSQTGSGGPGGQTGPGGAGGQTGPGGAGYGSYNNTGYGSNYRRNVNNEDD